MFASYCLLLAGTILFSTASKAQVNLQTGAAEQSFPLINYSDSKSGLTLSVAASYSSGNGLIVNSVASNLGTGWNLEAGGMVSRIQIGQPDDQPEFDNGYLTGDGALKRYPAGYLYNAAATIGCPRGTNAYPVFKDEGTLYKQRNSIAADLQQDLFVFSMNGHSGSFVIGRDWKAYTIGDSRIKIALNSADMTGQGIRTTIQSFTITTEDGIRYYFTDRALTQLTRYIFSTYNGTSWVPASGKPSDAARAVNRFYGYPLNADERPYVVSSWYLSRIENSNNGESIQFEYDTVTHDIINAKYISHSRDLNNTGKVSGINKNTDRKRNGTRWFNILSDPATAHIYSSDVNHLAQLEAGPTTVTYIRAITKDKRLKRIVFPNNGEVLLKYNSLPRVDLAGDNPFSRIEYWLSGKLIRGYEFEMGYFVRKDIYNVDADITGLDRRFARLCLRSFRKIGTGEDAATEPPYTFYYNTGQSNNYGLIPSDQLVPPQNFLGQDHWGYFNGNSSGLTLNEDHDFLSNPESEYYKTVLYGSHNSKEGYAKFGLLSDVKYPTGGRLHYEYQQNRRKTLFGNADDGGVSVSQTILKDDAGNDQVVSAYSYVLPNGRSSRWGYEQPSYTSLSHTIYDEKWFAKSYKYPGIEYPEIGVSYASSAFNWGKFALNTGVSFAGQLAIAALLPSSAVPIVNGVVLAVSATLFIVNSVKTYEFHRFNLTNSNDRLPNAVGGQFTRVEVATAGPQGYNGKTVYEFTGPDDYGLLVKENNWPFVQRQRAANWAYGLPKKITVYDKDGTVVSEKANEYKIYVDKLADANNINCACASREQYSVTSKEWGELDNFITYNTASKGVRPFAYYSYTGRADLVGTTQKEYVNGALYASDASVIINDPATLLQKGTIIRKDPNSTLVRITYYPNDYNIPGALQQLKDNNALHTPVATETWQLKTGTNSLLTGFLLDASVTEFKTYTFNGRSVVKPWKTWALKTAAPLSGSVIGNHNPSLLLRNPAYYKQTSELFYDGGGNLIQTIANDQVTSFINDYSDRYVVASVANAAYNDIAYTGFESNGKGNWNFTPSGITASGITGAQSFRLSAAASISTANTLSTTNAYYVTYWYKQAGSAPAVNGTAGEVLYQSPDGWALYRHRLTGISTVTVTGDGLIDELRLYPEGALMSTVTYKEGMGKIAECDANNRLLYYEYDGLGRLELIRDQNRNVIKTYEYNYKK
ncbi:MAG TPA: hypothetical protein VHK91_14865 [Flavisolibacter sp.]|nr:hypothetical protein [Flavisolibacter sp.]